MSYTAVSKTIERFEALGIASLAPRTRGRRSGEDRALSVEQEQAVQRTICDHRPGQLKVDFALCSRAAFMHLIEREYGIKLHVRSVGKYLARWGFPPQKPIKRAYEQSPAAVKEWLDTQYPQIAQRAKAEGAEVHWGDETALVNTDVRGRSFAPKGQTPVAVDGTRQKLIHDRPGQQARAVQNLLPRSVRQTHRMKLLSGRINRVFFHGLRPSLFSELCRPLESPSKIENYAF